jgi:diaminopimelate epimerase
MMKLKFKKYHGCYNEFICVDLRNIDFNIIQPMVPYMCQKKPWAPTPTHWSDYYMGADGLVAVQNSTIADFKMLIINADGSIPEMCGNGLRCFAAFLHHENITTKTQLKIETLAGVLDVTVVDDSFPKAIVTVEMGHAKLHHQLPPQDFSRDLRQHVSWVFQPFKITAVSMGNPHAVIFVDNANAVNIAELGPIIQNLSTPTGDHLFPNGVNVEFVSKSTSISNALEMRVFERGVGETMACGTGACAAAVAGYQHGICQEKTSVILKGGVLDIVINPNNFLVTMTGPAQCILNEIEL